MRERQVWAENLIKKINNKEVKLYYIGRSWDDMYAGDVIFITEEGDYLSIFNDCDSFDYYNIISGMHCTLGLKEDDEWMFELPGIDENILKTAKKVNFI